MLYMYMYTLHVCACVSMYIEGFRQSRVCNIHVDKRNEENYVFRNS